MKYSVLHSSTSSVKTVSNKYTPSVIPNARKVTKIVFA